MNAREIINGHGVEHDPSGVGHAWSPIAADDLPGAIAEEIADWIVEDDPEAGEEMIGSNGQHYRLPG